jgi:hypothetical protein
MNLPSVYKEILEKIKKRIPRQGRKANKPVRGSLDNFGEMQNVHEKWDLSEKDAYVKQHGRRKLPRFVVPAAIFLLIAVLLFWALPGLVSRFAQNTGAAPDQVTEPVRIYSADTRVVRVYAANLFTEADIKSPYITQVLFNEPVTVLDTDSEGFLHVSTADGLKGYIRSGDLTDKLDSVEPNLHKYKLVVSDISKNVMSHASNGTLLVQVMMNTVMYSDIKSDGVYQVALPDGTIGWISSSGVIELGIEDPVEKVGVRYFVSSVLCFVNATQIDHGITMRGLSVDGLAYVAAAVNGVTLPRTMEEQAAMGERVDLTYDAVTGSLNVTGIAPGDLVFFRDPNNQDSAAPYEMAICTDTGTLLMTSLSRTSLKLVTLTDDTELQSRIIAVRKIFD